MKEIISDYGEMILYTIVGILISGCLIMFLNAITSV